MCTVYYSAIKEEIFGICVALADMWKTGLNALNW